MLVHLTPDVESVDQLLEFVAAIVPDSEEESVGT